MTVNLHKKNPKWSKGAEEHVKAWNPGMMLVGTVCYIQFRRFRYYLYGVVNNLQHRRRLKYSYRYMPPTLFAP